MSRNGLHHTFAALYASALRRTRFASLVALASLSLLAGTASAATFIVDSFTDSISSACTASPNDCSLRGAILAANANPGDDVVLLGAGVYELSIVGGDEDLGSTGDLDVLDGLVIRGAGPKKTFIDANGIDRVLEVRAPGERLTLRGVVLTGGNTSGIGGAVGASGLGVRVEAGALRLETCGVALNSSSVAGLGGRGGAISDFMATASESIEIVDSFLFANGSSSCAAIYSAAELLLERSTVSGNTAESEFTICIHGAGSTLLNSTVRGNDTGISAFAAAVTVYAIQVTIASCTLADNTNEELNVPAWLYPKLANNVISGDCYVDGINSLGGNVESPGDTCELGAGDLVNVADLRLEAFAWTGGLAPVHRPLSDSPVVDLALADANCPPLDQRHLARPRDGNGGGSHCDAGAVELAGEGEIFIETFEIGFTDAWSAVGP